MNRSARAFVAVLAPTAIALAWLVIGQQLGAALAVGVAGTCIHWFVTRNDQHGDEQADASYFFGFLLTLVFLVSGLYGLASQQNAPGAVFAFLKELGAGLALTIVGLFIRQVRTLSRPSSEPLATDALTDAQRELATAMRALIRGLENRPEEIAARELQATRERAREATDDLERSVVRASERVKTSIDRLEEATTTVTSTLMRTSSGLGESLASSTERIQLEVGAALSLLETQRRQLESSLRVSQETTDATQRAVGAQMATQLAEWKATLEESRRYLATAHESLTAEYQQGLAGLKSAAAAFSELARQVLANVEALPDPAERLGGLWSGVATMESTLAKSVDATSQRLSGLGRESDAAAAAIARLERGAGGAAQQVERGGAELADALRRELVQMNELLDEYTRLLERNLVSPGAR